MTTFSNLSAAVAALLSPGAGAAKAAPASALPAVQFEEPVTPFRWSNPAAIEARPSARGVFANAGFYYGEFRGRKLELEEVLVGITPTENVTAWFSRQDVLLKGRSRTSRFDVQADTYGVRWVVKPPKDEDDMSLALEFEATRPDTASARTNNAAATYVATKNNRFAVAGAFKGGLIGQLAFTRVEGVNGEEANVYALGAAKDLELSDRFRLRLQGQIIGQNIRNTSDDADMEFKPVGFVALGYRLAKGVFLEGDVTFMPSGTPLSVGRLSALTSFQIYRPGGVAANLREDAFATGSLRLVVRQSF